MISIFANDFGEFHDVLEGRGDWDEGSYWLSMIRDFCFAHEIERLFVAAPWLNQIDGPEMAGNYPGKIANVLEATGLAYLNPIADFANAELEIRNRLRALGPTAGPSVLFNGRIGDGHFSGRGAEIWAAAVGRRMALLIQKRLLADAALEPTPAPGPEGGGLERAGPIPRSP